MALDCGLEVYPLAFDYAQRHRRELSSSLKVVSHYRERGASIMSLRTVRLMGLDFSSSALTSDLAVPQDGATKADEIPVTYVPARNSIFLSIGTAFAESIGADSVWTGFNAVDYSGYPDCRPEYVTSMEESLALGTKRGVQGRPIRLIAPIIRATKPEIIRAALKSGAPLHLTWSCYVGLDRPCGTCDSCRIRDKAFADLDMQDPAAA